METIDLKIITIEGVFFDGEVGEIILPAENGQISILPNHIAMVSKLKKGVVLLKLEKGEKSIRIPGGVLEVRPGSEVYILTHSAKEI